MFSARRILVALLFATLVWAAPAKHKPARTAINPPIDLNTASPKDLQELPGVGSATAKRIIAGRPYSSAADLARVGVSRKTINAITPMVTASASSVTSAESGKLAPLPPTPGMVWVNLDSKRFHLEGSRWYGNTRNGKYMTEPDARHAGYKPAKE